MEYASAAWERTMRMQDVILRAVSGESQWFQAAEILQGRAPRGALNADHWTRKALLGK